VFDDIKIEFDKVLEKGLVTLGVHQTAEKSTKSIDDVSGSINQ